MKANKKDLKKLEKQISGLRDLIEAKKWSFSPKDTEEMANNLYDAEAVIRTIASLCEEK